MATKNDIIIKIGASAQEFQKELNKTRKHTKELENNLKKTGKVAGIAFAAGVGSIGLLVNAYKRQEQAELQVQQTIRSTGAAAGLTAKEIFKMASSLQEVTTFGDEAILEGQNLLLTFTKIGKDVFPQATETMLDMSAKMKVDLKTSAIQLGKALNDPISGVTALSRVGVKFNDGQKKQIKAFQETGNIVGAQKVILKELELQMSGTARTMAKGTGKIDQATNSFADLGEELGRHLTPYLIKVSVPFKKFIDFLRNNETATKFLAGVVLTGTAVAGLTAALALGSIAFLNIRSAMIAANISTRAMAIGVKGLVGATGIGLLLLIGSELYLNWETIWPKMQKTFHAFASNIGNVAGGIGKILSGAFTFNMSRLKEGLSETKAALAKGFNETVAAMKTESEKPENKIEIKTSTSEKSVSKEAPVIDNDTKAKIEKKKQEIEVLKQIQNDADAEEIELLKRKHEIETQEREAQLIKNDELRALENERIKLSKEQLLEDEEDFRQKQLEQHEIDKEFKDLAQQLSDEEKAALREADIREIKSHMESKAALERKDISERLKRQIEADKKFLADQKKFGTTMATLKKILRTEEVQGARRGFSELEQLTQSHNKTLKSIGKVAAVANIIIRTAESAMNIYSGFSTIPIIGPALGVAGAAAAVAFGAEQVTRVKGAKKGTLVDGIGFGDTQPFMLEPGEFVSPRHDAAYHIDSVADRKAREIVDENNGIEAAQGEQSGIGEVLIKFKDDAMDILEAEFRKRNGLEIGGVLA